MGDITVLYVQRLFYLSFKTVLGMFEPRISGRIHGSIYRPTFHIKIRSPTCNTARNSAPTCDAMFYAFFEK